MYHTRITHRPQPFVEKLKSAPYRRLGSLALGEWKLLSVGSLALVGSAAGALVIPMYTGSAIDSILEGVRYERNRLCCVIKRFDPIGLIIENSSDPHGSVNNVLHNGRGTNRNF